MLKSEFKQKYAKGTNLKPTFEECWDSVDCTKHFRHATKKYFKMLKEEELYDLYIDCLNYTIKHFNGKSGFLTLLYRVSYQQCIKFIRKKIKKSIFKSSKFLDSASVVDGFNFSIDLTKEEFDLLNMKYVEKHTNEEISDLLGMPKDDILKKIYNLKKKIKSLA